MTALKVSLFGKFNIISGRKSAGIVLARKVQELFIYLLLYRNHPQPRESLSELLWADQPANKSRKSLRQALWQLQAALKRIKDSSKPALLIENGWIFIDLPANFCLDTTEFEHIFGLVNDKRVRDLTAEDFAAMQYAINLYRGDLLEGWYQDWCIFERERFQIMYITLLDKLVQYSEIHQKYDTGLSYGWQILRYDHAYERAHRQMMRLYYKIGDRTQALHQYERCVAALRDELGVEPSERTKQLYEQIRSDALKPPSSQVTQKRMGRADPAPALNNVLSQLEQFKLILRTMDAQIQKEISALKSALTD